MKVGIIGAMEQEVALLRSQLSRPPPCNWAAASSIRASWPVKR